MLISILQWVCIAIFEETVLYWQIWEFKQVVSTWKNTCLQRILLTVGFTILADRGRRIFLTLCSVLMSKLMNPNNLETASTGLWWVGGRPERDWSGQRERGPGQRTAEYRGWTLHPVNQDTCLHIFHLHIYISKILSKPSTKAKYREVLTIITFWRINYTHWTLGSGVSEGWCTLMMFMLSFPGTF